MKYKLKKYGRWDETCNWQLESVVEKTVEIKESYIEFLELCGYTYSERYNEFYAVSEDKHRMTVITGIEE